MLSGEEKMRLKIQTIEFFFYLFCIFLGVFILIASASFPNEAIREPIGVALFPRLAAFLLIVSSSVCLLSMNKEYFKLEGDLSSEELLIFLVTLILMIAYGLLLKSLGFVITTFLVMMVMTLLLGGKKILEATIVCLVVTGLIFYLFRVVFSIPLPMGLFF